MGDRNEGIVRAPVVLQGHGAAVLPEELDLDAAAGIALEADGMERVFRPDEIVLLLGGELPRLGPAHQVRGPVELRGEDRTAENRGALQEIPPVCAVPARLFLFHLFTSTTAGCSIPWG